MCVLKNHVIHCIKILNIEPKLSKDEMWEHIEIFVCVEIEVNVIIASILNVYHIRLMTANPSKNFKSGVFCICTFFIKISKSPFLVISNFMSKRITEVIDYKRSNQSAWHGPLSIYKRKTLQKYHIKTETRRMIFKDFPDIADSCFIFFYCKLY